MNANVRTNLAYVVAALAGLALLTYCFFSQAKSQHIDSLTTAVGGGMMALVIHYRNNRKQRQS
ncbi:hypothetical protein F5984_05990 [Rudanella paleaurantiibacter]|uniref:Uncharacterized protein n=1 Tax=Rudanella paleaurantiibacter TaxID=2614655 RepID=A0A7J5U1U4_9BACT|nr:hypothetical protein [Rudanella paleaurantiibacter]KAB7731774.1 hypothetical protein F5984_05990 [Rudanella paleaurantiibacter]